MVGAWKDGRLHRCIRGARSAAAYPGRSRSPRGHRTFGKRRWGETIQKLALAGTCEEMSWHTIAEHRLLWNNADDKLGGVYIDALAAGRGGEPGLADRRPRTRPRGNTSRRSAPTLGTPTGTACRRSWGGCVRARTTSRSRSASRRAAPTSCGAAATHLSLPMSMVVLLGRHWGFDKIDEWM